MTTDIITDLSVLTKISPKILKALTDTETLCIGSAIADAKVENLDTIVLGVGIGNLSVDLTTMTCKFVPSTALKQAIKRAVAGTADPLESKLEQAMIDKLLAACEDFI